MVPPRICPNLAARDKIFDLVLGQNMIARFSPTLPNIDRTTLSILGPRLVVLGIDLAALFCLRPATHSLE